MEKLITNKDAYIADYIYGEDKLLALTKKNARFIKGIILMDSRYSKDFIDEEKVEGSLKSLFVNLKEKYDKEQLLKIITELDKTNSTHLEASENGRAEMADKINKSCQSLDELIKQLKVPINKLDENHIIFKMTKGIPAEKDKNELRHNLSFATKFCSYASRCLLGETTFPKYDSVVSKALPKYVEIYLGYKRKNNEYVLNNNHLNKLKNKTEDENIKFRINMYINYSNDIYSIKESIKERELTLDDIDQIIWYSKK